MIFNVIVRLRLLLSHSRLFLHIFFSKKVRCLVVVVVVQVTTISCAVGSFFALIFRGSNEFKKNWSPRHAAAEFALKPTTAKCLRSRRGKVRYVLCQFRFIITLIKRSWFDPKKDPRGYLKAPWQPVSISQGLEGSLQLLEHYCAKVFTHLNGRLERPLLAVAYFFQKLAARKLRAFDNARALQWDQGLFVWREKYAKRRAIH